MAAAIPGKELRGSRRSTERNMAGGRAWRYIGAALFLLPAIGLSVYIATPDLKVGYCSFKYRDVIATEAEAILKSRQLWFCIKSDIEPASEQLWQEGFVADHDAGEWHIRQTHPEGHVGSNLHLHIADNNGRLRGLYITD